MEGGKLAQLSILTGIAWADSQNFYSLYFELPCLLFCIGSDPTGYRGKGAYNAGGFHRVRELWFIVRCSWLKRRK